MVDFKLLSEWLRGETENEKKKKKLQGTLFSRGGRSYSTHKNWFLNDVIWFDARCQFRRFLTSLCLAQCLLDE